MPSRGGLQNSSRPIRVPSSSSHCSMAHPTAAAARTGARLAHQLLAGIKRLENLLYPFAGPRGDLPSFR